MLASQPNRPFLTKIALFATLFMASSFPAAAATLANCDPADTLCFIPNDVLVQLPNIAVAGDVVVLKSDGVTVADVFRFFNDIVNTGLGTGLGETAELFNPADGPVPTTYSANVTYITVATSGYTSYTNNGTTYVLGVPEPQSVALVSLASACLLLWRRKQTQNSTK